MNWVERVALPASALSAARFVWVLLRKVRRAATPELSDDRRGHLAWIGRLAWHAASRKLKRQWYVRFAVERYARTLYTEHRNMSVPGRDVLLPIDQCFIPLEFRSGQVSDINQVLEQRGLVLVLGDPGSGKSALLSQMARISARECLDNPTASRLPLHLPLSHVIPAVRVVPADTWNGRKAMSILESWFAEAHLDPASVREANEIVSHLAGDPRAGVVVLLDGLDELNPDLLEPMEQFVLCLCDFLRAAGGPNLVVLATRRQALEFTPRLCSADLPNTLSVELSRFTPAAIYSFLVRWPYRQGDPHEEANRLFNQLRMNSTLLDTCSNPLALALYVNRDIRLRELGSDAGLHPDTRASFYTDVVTYILFKRRTDRLGQPARTPAFLRSRMDFFIRVVVDHIDNRETFNRISDDILMRRAELIVQDSQAPGDAIAVLAKDTGLIGRNDDGTWSFIHRSFLDYFLACSLAAETSKNQIKRLLRHLQVDSLRYLEAFYLACGLMARNPTHLYDVLQALGNNAFVGRYYPRAVHEAQAYQVQEFVERTRYYCNLWKRDRGAQLYPDVLLLRELVSVLLDYEASCRDLGRSPTITLESELGPALRQEGATVLQIAQLDLSLARRLSADERLPKLLLESSVEDAVVALYEPEVVGKISPDAIRRHPRLAALLAEAALRSSLVATRLSGLGLARGEHHGRNSDPWAQVWCARRNRLGTVLDLAVPYVRALPPAERATFPHVALLTYVRPIKRLRYELVWGDWRPGALVVSVAACMAIVGVLISGGLITGVAVGLGAIALAAIMIRGAGARGWIVSLSARALNVRPAGVNLSVLLGYEARVVVRRHAVPRISWRRPRSRGGHLVAVYDRGFPLLWRRFCPKLGDRRLSLVACATLQQQMTTEDVRRLIRGD